MNRFIIADPKKCIGCHTCEVACVVSHQEQETGIETVVKDEFFPRIHVMKGYTISTAVVCRQCEDHCAEHHSAVPRGSPQVRFMPYPCRRTCLCGGVPDSCINGG